jgi:hypothetical protein
VDASRRQLAPRLRTAYETPQTNLVMDVERDRAVELLADRLRILGQPLRIRLLNRLHESPATVQELVNAVGGVQQDVSQHLA